MPSRLIATSALIALAIAGCGGQRSHVKQPSDAVARSRTAQPVADAGRADRANIRDVIRRFNQASLAGHSGAMCALVDPAKLQYLEQIGNPCQMLYAGRLTAESAREVRNGTITSIEIKGDGAVAHIGGTSGAQDLRLHHRGGTGASWACRSLRHERNRGRRAPRPTLSLRAEAIARRANGAGPSRVVTGAARGKDRSGATRTPS
jgi:hypothetical protein